LATTFDELQVRIRELANAIPPTSAESHSTFEETPPVSFKEVGFADANGSNTKEGKASVKVVQAENDLDELTITEVEAELLNFATSKSSGPEYPINDRIVDTKNNFFGIGVVPSQENLRCSSPG